MIYCPATLATAAMLLLVCCLAREVQPCIYIYISERFTVHACCSGTLAETQGCATCACSCQGQTCARPFCMQAFVFRQAYKFIMSGPIQGCSFNVCWLIVDVGKWHGPVSRNRRTNTYLIINGLKPLHDILGQVFPLLFLQGIYENIVKVILLYITVVLCKTVLKVFLIMKCYIYLL